jgi:6-phosphofructokinase 1
LGHVQRGGDPSAFDRNFGTKCGAKCVDMLLQGETGAVGLRNGKYVFVSIEDALKGNRKFNMDDYVLAQRLSF